MNTAAATDTENLADVADLKLGDNEYKTMDISMSLDEEFEYEDLMNEIDDPPKATVAAAQQAKDLISKASHFNRRQLKQSPEWKEWKQAEWGKLNEMQVCKMCGSPVSRSDLLCGTEIYDVMRVVWSYLIRLHTQVKKARVCGDSRPLRPKKKSIQKTYAACTLMTGLRLLMAIAAYKNRILMVIDAVNAYAQSGPLAKKMYDLVVDDAIQDIATSRILD